MQRRFVTLQYTLRLCHITKVRLRVLICDQIIRSLFTLTVVLAHELLLRLSLFSIKAAQTFCWPWDNLRYGSGLLLLL